jgi:Carboxypeptidase regulatory-like domain/TonB dependent receptor
MTVVRRFLLVCAMLALPGIGYAQEAVLTGTVTDSTGAVLPGVTVTATNEATGNIFEAVTDSRGTYTIPVRVGVYRIKAELQSFTTVTRAGVQLLVGQTVTINVQMVPGGVAETVTVSAEAPLINTATSSLGGNIDPHQMQELPVIGRSWMALTMLAPGSRTTNENVLQPQADTGSTSDVRAFQINLDGQQVSAELAVANQPRYSLDAIAEFQFIANRFDATMGRSTGIQVNVVTKSGTNQFSGLFRSSFRDSRFNAANPVLLKVVPQNNQQFSTAVGGPIVRDKLHFFGNFEGEREPTTSIWNTPYPAFNVTLTGTNTVKKGGARVDYQLSPRTRLMVKESGSTTWQPFLAGSTNHPAGTSTNGEHNREGYARLTQVLSNRAVNDLEGGEAVYGFHQEALTTWTHAWYAAEGFPVGSPRITFKGFSIAPNFALPKAQAQYVWSAHDNFTYSYDAGGRHDLRIGGEILARHRLQDNRSYSTGQIDATLGLPPNLPQIFPDPFNVDTWNFAAISPYVRSYIIGAGDFNVNIYQKKVAAWVQDDWKRTDRLTLNLGVRYDLTTNAFANNISFPPFQSAGRPSEYTNVQPRVGFAYKLNTWTVLRGGAGLYYGDTLGDSATAVGNAQVAQFQYFNDGRPDFAANPTNGQPLPTYAQAQQQYCYANNNAPGCLLRSVAEVAGPPQYVHMPRAFQTSIGFQRQFGDTMAVEADYVYSHGSNEKSVLGNINLTFNPATGANYPFTNRSLRPFPNWGAVGLWVGMGRSEYQGLRTTVTKRFSQHWQASATYTLAYLWDAGAPPFSGLQPVPFPTSPELGGEWSLSNQDQRHRAVFNAVWLVGRGFQVSGLHYVGSGMRLATIYGGDLGDTGVQADGRLRPDGTVVARNSLVGPAQNRTDLRLQQKLPLHGRLKIDAIVEAFNLFNRPNWGIGTEQDRTDYLQHTTGEYRAMQAGFRLTF